MHILELKAKNMLLTTLIESEGPKRCILKQKTYI